MDRTCKLLKIDASDPQKMAISEEIQLGGHKGMVRSVKFSKDASKLLTAGQDTVVKLWDLETLQQSGTFHSNSRHVNWFKKFFRFIVQK